MSLLALRSSETRRLSLAIALQVERLEIVIPAAGIVPLLSQKRLPVGDRDLIVVGVNFAEGQKSVAVSAIIDEGRLQRRLDARYLCRDRYFP